jgi:hypothetical protein
LTRSGSSRATGVGRGGCERAGVSSSSIAGRSRIRFRARAAGVCC